MDASGDPIQPISTPPKSPRPAARMGCVLWIISLLGSTSALFALALHFDLFRLFGPPGPPWQSLLVLLFVFGPQLIAVLWYMMRQLRRYRREERKWNHHCVVCNYDLRATPDRCPECGTVPQRS